MIKNIFRNMPLKQKILSMFFVILISITIVAVLAISFLGYSYSEFLYESVAVQLSYSAAEFADNLSEIETVEEMIYSSNTVQNGLRVMTYLDDNIMRSAANDSLRNSLINLEYNLSDSGIKYTALYCGDFVVSGNSYEMNKDSQEVLNYLREKAAEGEGGIVWTAHPKSPDKIYLVRQIRNAYNLSLESLGEEIICVDVEYLLEKSTKTAVDFENSYFFLFVDNKNVYGTKEFSLEQITHIENNLTEQYKVIMVDGNYYFAVGGVVPSHQWEYICLLPYNSMVFTQMGIQNIFIVFLLICVVLAWIFVAKFTNSLDKHIHVLVQKMKAMGKNTPKEDDFIYDYKTRNDEIGILHQQFDLMVKQLKELIDKNYVNEILKKEAQLKALENQINPHFLYNTLESVNWRAKAMGAKDISAMVESLAVMLRATLSKSDTVFTLKKELHLVENYMIIQKYRFDDRLQYDISAEPELYDIEIPKLIIQPLVENAIHYGLEENTEECMIHIKAEKAENTVKISVSNTGSFFDEDLMERLQNGEISPKGHGIGLVNIQKRIQMSFGNQYGITLYNQDDEAVAVISLPVKKEV